MVTWENYEEYLLLHVDGELNDAEQKALLDFIALHPEVENELKMSMSTILTSDTTVCYEHKETLLKPVPVAKTIALGQWWRYGVAAGVLLMVSVFAFRQMSSDNGREITNTDVATLPIKETKTRVPAPVVRPTANSALQSPPPVSHREKSSSIARNSVHSSTSEIAKKAGLEKMEIKTIKPITSEIAVEVTPAPVELLPVSESPLFPEQSAVPEKLNSNLLAWLPEEKKEGLELLKKDVGQKMDKANEIRESIKDTQLALKLGNKELIVINF